MPPLGSSAKRRPERAQRFPASAEEFSPANEPTETVSTTSASPHSSVPACDPASSLLASTISSSGESCPVVPTFFRGSGGPAFPITTNRGRSGTPNSFFCLAVKLTKNGNFHFSAKLGFGVKVVPRYSYPAVSECVPIKSPRHQAISNTEAALAAFNERPMSRLKQKRQQHLVDSG